MAGKKEDPCVSPKVGYIERTILMSFFVKTQKRTLENQNFYLLHLCLLREYLEVDFEPLKATLRFAFDLERIIDDFIFMMVFIGNDFLPNLPGFNINDGALATIFEVYRQILPTLGLFSFLFFPSCLSTLLAFLFSHCRSTSAL